MKMTITASVLAKLTVGLAFVGIFSIPYLIGWTSAYQEVTCYALFALVSVTGGSWVIIALKRRPSLQMAVFMSVMLSQSAIYFYLTVNELLEISQTEPQFSPYIMAEETVNLCLMSVTAAIGSAQSSRAISPKRCLTVAVLACVTIVAVRWVLVSLVMAQPTEAALLLLVAPVSLVSAGAAGIAAIWLIAARPTGLLFDRGWFIVSMLALALGSALMWYFTVIGFSSYGLSMRVTGTVLLALAVAVPAQLDVGIRRLDAEIAPLLSSLIGIGTFLLLVFAEVVSPGTVRFTNVGAYQLAHALSMLLCGVMAVHIYTYAERTGTLGLHLVAITFAFWTLAQATILFGSFGEKVATIGESIFPYMMGAAFSFVAMLTAIYSAGKERTSPIITAHRNWVLAALGLISFVLIGGTLAEQTIVPANPELVLFRPTYVILFSLSLAISAAVVPLSFIIVYRKQTWRNLEGVAAAIMVTVNGPIILKSIFPPWTAGWWSAEMGGVFGLLMAPAIVGILYLDSMSDAREAEGLANLYSDILAHDITNMHQAMVVSLSMLDMHDIPKGSREMALEDARASLARAIQIVTSVRSLSSATSSAKPAAEGVELVQAIRQAYENVKLQMPADNIDFSISEPNEKSIVSANGLIVELFYNLLSNAVRYSKPATDSFRPFIRVEIVQRWQRGRWCWETRLIDNGRGITPEMKGRLFRRFMNGATGVGLGLAVAHSLTRSYGGTLTVEDRVAGAYREGSVFVVTLPSMSADERAAKRGLRAVEVFG